MTPGAAFTLKYSSTIPHTGTFKLFLTKQGYSPTRALKWSDLPEKPFATATDPALVDGAYRISAKLPSDRTGRQMLFTIWQNSSTPDTYYSCSDVVFSGGSTASKPTGAAGASGGGGTSDAKSAKDTPRATRSASSKPSRTATPTAADSPSPAVASPAGEAGPDGLTPAASSTSGGGPALPLVAGGAAAALLLTAGVAFVLRRRG
jgi:chitin-binding protein